jgi:hypothetical protein
MALSSLTSSSNSSNGALSLTVSGELAPVTSTRRPSHSSTSLFSKPLSLQQQQQQLMHSASSTTTTAFPMLTVDAATGSPSSSPPRSPASAQVATHGGAPSESEHSSNSNGRALFGSTAGAGRTRAVSSGHAAAASGNANSSGSGSAHASGGSSSTSESGSPNAAAVADGQHSVAVATPAQQARMAGKLIEA